MDIKKLTSILTAAGLVLIVVAVIWWAVSVSKVGGIDDLSGAFHCLFSSGGFCGIFSYNPMVFWVGAVLLLVGVVLKYSQSN